MLPIVSGAGFLITGLFAGAVVIENIFTFSGMGQMYVQAIGVGDWPVAYFLILFYGVLGVIGALLSDIALTIFDPRIRIK